MTVEHTVGVLIPIPEDEDIEDMFCQVENKCQEFERDVSWRLNNVNRTQKMYISRFVMPW